MMHDDEVSTMPGVAEVAPPNYGGPQVLQPPAQENSAVTAATEQAAQEARGDSAPARPRRSPAKVKGKAKVLKGKGKIKIKGKGKAKTAGAGRPAILRPTATLTVLARKNPWRPGSKAQVEFDKFKTGATVAATLKRGVRPRFLLWSRKLNHVKISA